MSQWISRHVLALLLLGAAFLGGCAPSLPPVETPVWHLVVLGDSSLWELGRALEARIEQELGVEVVVDDYAWPRLSAGEVLQVLQTGASQRSGLESLPAALAEAEIVVMLVNPLHSIIPEKPLDLEGCFLSAAPGACDPETFERWTADLRAIWAEILLLRKGQPTILRATDLYNPLVVPWNKAGVFEACTSCWVNMSQAARLAAETYGIPFLSRLEAYNGPNFDQDPREKGYIARDGEHPSERGAIFTADMLVQMGFDGLPQP